MAAWVLLLGVAAGCRSPKLEGVDWDSRVGRMTYEEVVAELGEPRTTAELSDGFRVAQWAQRRTFADSNYNIFREDWVETPESGRPTGTLNLSFDPDGVLYGWKWVYK